MTTAINAAATSGQSNLSRDRELCKPPSVAQAARLDRELRDDQLNAVSGGFGSAISSIGHEISGAIGK